MFELSQKEFKSLIESMRSQFVTSQLKSTTYAPYVFSEHDVFQLSHVLKSTRTKKMSIRIIEVFVCMREMLMTHKDILQKLERPEKKDIELVGNIYVIFEYLKQLEKAKHKELEQKNRPEIGFKND